MTHDLTAALLEGYWEQKHLDSLISTSHRYEAASKEEKANEGSQVQKSILGFSLISSGQALESG